MHITVIAHSTVLIETAGGVRLMADPLFGIQGAMRGRVRPALPPERVADVDAVMLTHAHPDHLDPGYLAMLAPETAVIVPDGFEWPEGVSRPRRVEELRSWESRSFGMAEVTSVPATHRGPSCGYVVEADGRAVYVAGDTHYDDAMPEVGRHWRLDMALLPERVGPEIPVMDADEAVDAVRALHPRAVLLYHLGVSRAAGGPVPPDDYIARLRDEAPDAEVRLAREGERIVV